MITLFVLGIHILNKDDKQLIFKIGDSLSLSINSNNIQSYDDYYKDYLGKNLEGYIIYGDQNYRIGELVRDIKSNIEINNRSIQNILIKSDLVIIEIGIDELYMALNVNDKYKYLDGMIDNMDELVKEVKKYCKEKVLLIGYYNPSNKDNLKYVNYINERYFDISKKYNISYLDISELNNPKYFSGNNYHLNDRGYLWLNSQIIQAIY
jgi:lysophospholipase L1-like esterase